MPELRLIILARNLHERQLERGVVGNNTPAIMMTLCFVGGKERQKSRIMRDVSKSTLQAYRTAFPCSAELSRKGAEQDMALFLA